MGRRAQERIRAVLPVRVSGKSPDGAAFSELAYTLDISRSGARVVLQHSVAEGEPLSIAYKQKKGTFTAQWTSAMRGGGGTMVGICNTDPASVLWSEINSEEKKNYRDEFTREERGRQEAVLRATQLAKEPRAGTTPAPPAPAASPAVTATSSPAAQVIASETKSAAPSAAAPAVAVATAKAASPVRPTAMVAIAERLPDVTANLLLLEEQLRTEDVDPAMLREFREALTKTRETAWIAQQREELERESGGTPLVSLINNERLNSAVRLCNEFMDDFSKADLALDEKPVRAFLQIAEQLVFELALAVS